MKSGLNEKWIVCRVCLKQPKEIMQTIFDDKDEKDLTKMIFECGGVPIKKYDHYPDKICSKCLKCLHLAYKFRTTCQRSHKHLSRFIAPVEVGGGEDIETEQIRDDNDNSSDIMTDLNEEVEIINDDADNIALKLEPNDIDDMEIKEELTSVDDEILEEDFNGMDPDVVDVFEPMEDDELGEIQALDQDGMNDEIEYLDDIGGENPATSDEEFLPNSKSSRNKNLKKVTKNLSLKSGKGRVGRPPGRSNSGIRTEKKDPKSKSNKEKYFICDVCGNIYPTQGRLREHLKLHQGIKPHECEICGHAFAQTQQLARHMNTHTGNRPYKCNYCPAAFADLSTRNKHHRIHTNERPYVCDVCGKSFSYTNTLKFHKMTHTGEKPFVCDLCGKGFQQAYKLRNHKQTHEKRGIKIQKIDPDALQHTYQEASVAASQILEI